MNENKWQKSKQVKIMLAGSSPVITNYLLWKVTQVI